MFVLDASTLILIAKAELLGPFLAGVKLKVAVPGEVARECCGAKMTLDGLMIQKALVESRIKVIHVKNRKLVGKLQADFSLGQGEAEAIALALKQRERIIGIDDKNGINACKLLGMAFTTAGGLLLRSHQKGLLDRSAAFAGLAALAKYGRYKDSIIEDARLKLEVRE
jgi:predicted nucleic acid-binding protein